MKEAAPLLHFINKFLPLSEEDFVKYIQPRIVIRKFEKKQFLIQAGEVENYFNFITEGLIRKFYLKGKEEIHTQISHENQIILVQDSFLSRQPSDYFLEALESTTVISVSYDDLETIFSSSERMQHLGRLVVTSIAVVQDKWQSKLIKQSPRERFLEFVSKNADLLQRVPQKYLASLLDIKPETFSRFKHLVKGSKAKK